ISSRRYWARARGRLARAKEFSLATGPNQGASGRTCMDQASRRLLGWQLWRARVTGSGQPTGPPVTPQRLMQLAWGYAPPLIVQAAIDVGVFAALEHGPRTLAELTAETG